MRDATLHQSDAAVAADAFAGAMEIQKTPAAGIWLMFRITRNDADADETLNITVYDKDTDAAWNAGTDRKVSGVTSVVNADVANGGTIVRYVLVQSDRKYLNPYYDVGGTTPSWTIECSVVSGPDQPQTV